MKRGWVFGGWIIALLASLVPALWLAEDKIVRNPLGKYVDAATGEWTSLLYEHVFHMWLSLAIPVSLLALACMFLNRRS